jgi:trans-aconitate methyltransferase
MLITMGADMSHKELPRVGQIASIYHSDSLAGANERFHIHLRNNVIPAGGGSSALELGCAKGLWTQVLCDRYERLDVVDGSAELLAEVARSCAGRAHLTTHTALAEEFLFAASETWQDIYMTFLLEHIEEPVELLRLARSHLAENGVLFVAVPNANSVHRVLALRAGLIQSTTELSENDIRVGHRRVYTKALLREHLRQANLRITLEKPVGLKPLTLKQLERLPDAVNAALCASGDLAPANSAYLAAEARA